MKKKRKRSWKRLEIKKVELNPEQAVLGCCWKASKGFSLFGTQCSGLLCAPINSQGSQST
ncbi:MAG: hypothetical protein ACM3OC_02680 [Deltaproteobacteria bacterium]